MNIDRKSLSLLAGSMLLLAIPPIWPYGYYQLLRWVVSGVAIYNAYGAFKLKKNNWASIMVVVAVVFNPIAPFFLDKNIWVVFDLLAAFAMFVFRKRVQEMASKEKVQ